MKQLCLGLVAAIVLGFSNKALANDGLHGLWEMESYLCADGRAPHEVAPKAAIEVTSVHIRFDNVLRTGVIQYRYEHCYLSVAFSYVAKNSRLKMRIVGRMLSTCLSEIEPGEIELHYEFRPEIVGDPLLVVRYPTRFACAPELILRRANDN